MQQGRGSGNVKPQRGPRTESLLGESFSIEAESIEEIARR